MFALVTRETRGTYGVDQRTTRTPSNLRLKLRVNTVIREFSFWNLFILKLSRFLSNT